MCSEVRTATKLGALHETRDAKLANGGYPFLRYIDATTRSK